MIVFGHNGKFIFAISMKEYSLINKSHGRFFVQSILSADKDGNLFTVQ